MMTKVLVTGATGNVGSWVVRELRERGVSVRAFVRDPGKASAMLGEGVELAVGDFGDPESIRAALNGVDGVFLACANQSRQIEYETGVIDAAASAGGRRIVKLSARGTEIGSPVAFWDWHARIEEHLRASGAPFAVLRPSFSMANLLASAEAVQHTGKLFAPAGDARVSMAHPRDVGAVASVALVEDGHEGETYTLTGPEAITFDQVAGHLSEAVGREIEFLNVPDEAARQGMIEHGLPEFVAGQIVAVFGVLRQGAQDRTTDAVRALTGREPRGFAEYARDHARWFAPPLSDNTNARKRHKRRGRRACLDAVISRSEAGNRPTRNQRAEDECRKEQGQMHTALKKAGAWWRRHRVRVRGLRLG